MSDFPILKLLIFPPFAYYTLWKEVTMYNPCIKSREVFSTSLRACYLNKLFGILLYGRFVSTHYSFIYSCIFISMDSWMLFQLWLLRFLQWWLCSCNKLPSLFLSCLFAFCYVFSMSLLTKRCSRLILYNSCPHPRIIHFSNELKFILLENVIEN